MDVRCPERELLLHDLDHIREVLSCIEPCDLGFENFPLVCGVRPRLPAWRMETGNSLIQKLVHSGREIILEQ
jgi:hypothetical protein